MPNDFDKASRLAFKLDPVGMLCWSMGIGTADFAFRGWLDTRDAPFPGHPDRTGDTVAAVEETRTGGVPWALAVEFQIEPDPLMFGRMLGYLSGLWVNLKPDPERGSRYNVGGIVLNLTGNGNGSREMVWAGSAVQTRLGLCERNLESESASDTLDAVEAGRVAMAILPWIPLMRGADTSDIMERWKRIAETGSSDERKSEYATLALAFAVAQDRDEMWKQSLKGWNVKTNRIMDELRAEGIEQGIGVGIGLGELRGQRGSIRRLLQHRFGPIPDEFVNRLELIDDSSVLDEWLFEASTSADLMDFLGRTRNH